MKKKKREREWGGRGGGDEVKIGCEAYKVNRCVCVYEMYRCVCVCVCVCIQVRVGCDRCANRKLHNRFNRELCADKTRV